MHAWFYYHGGYECAPENYTKIDDLPKFPGNDVLYAIFAKVEMKKNKAIPEIPLSLRIEILTAIANKQETENVKLRAY